MSRRRLQHLALLVGLLALVVINAVAAKPATPGFEVKFFLDPGKTLNASNVPTPDVLTAFNAAGPLSINMQFLDGPGLQLHKAGWNVRFRTIEGKDEMELTYKRRSPIPIGLDAALKRAEVDGFGKEEKKAEVEWGFQQRTLTFSREQNEPAANSVLPLIADARTRALASMPDKLTPHGWAKGILSGARIANINALRERPPGPWASSS
jgi:hypothetical protein